ncbi:MAG TPA: RDD family protein [Flavobacterium sp.]|nr:RDD family protein [Flavobacterium sp.]
METHEIAQQNKAVKGLRLINYIIDFIASILFMMLALTIMICIAFLLNTDIVFIFESDFIMESLAFIFYALYYFLIENFSKGRSIGKLITGTKVVTLSGEVPTRNTFFRRSLYRLIPFEQFSFVGENGWHDSISRTIVVVKKHFDYEMRINSKSNF